MASKGSSVHKMSLNFLRCSVLVVLHRAALLHVLLETFPEAATHLSVGCSTPAELSVPTSMGSKHLLSHLKSHNF